MDKGLYDDVDEICQAVHYRLSRKVLPRITEDGYVEYGLQIPHNYQTRAASISVQIPSSKSKTEFGPDVEWILRGSGSTSRGSAGSVHQSLGTQCLKITFKSLINCERSEFSFFTFKSARCFECTLF